MTDIRATQPTANRRQLGELPLQWAPGGQTAHANACSNAALHQADVL